MELVNIRVINVWSGGVKGKRVPVLAYSYRKAARRTPDLRSPSEGRIAINTTYAFITLFTVVAFGIQEKLAIKDSAPSPILDPGRNVFTRKPCGGTTPRPLRVRLSLCATAADPRLKHRKTIMLLVVQRGYETYLRLREETVAVN